jgi:hypothetical protein
VTHDDRITKFLQDYKYYSVTVDGDTLTLRKRNVGDIWLDIDGKWCGMSPDGESGPWETRRAAQHAANGEFRAAATTNFRRN